MAFPGELKLPLDRCVKCSFKAVDIIKKEGTLDC